MALFDKFLGMLSNRVDVAVRYELMREAISGTMSNFYKATDRQTGKVVGLKILDPDKVNIVETRFKAVGKPSEAEIGTALKHPNIVRTLDSGVTTKNQQYIVLEFLEGPGLNSLLLSRSPLLEGKRL